jgi:hypothetical protein
MSGESTTLIFWVEGREDAEKVFETRAASVPRIGDQVQLGPYGGPYEWRRVLDVTWRHNTEVRGGVSVIVSLASETIASGDRDRKKAKAG